MKTSGGVIREGEAYSKRQIQALREMANAFLDDPSKGFPDAEWFEGASQECHRMYTAFQIALMCDVDEQLIEDYGRAQGYEVLTLNVGVSTVVKMFRKADAEKIVLHFRVGQP
jgi:hypothetical protein